MTDVIADTLLCQVNDSATFLTAYIWIMTDGDAVGICTMNEVGTQYSSTAPIIGTECVMESVLGAGLVTLNFAATPPTLSGAFTG